MDRENPDSSRGLFVTRAVLEQAKLVQEAKLQKKVNDEAKKEINMAKNTELTTKKSKALSRLTVTMLKSPSLLDALKDHNAAGYLKLSYQHLGGKTTNLPARREERDIYQAAVSGGKDH